MPRGREEKNLWENYIQTFFNSFSLTQTKKYDAIASSSSEQKNLKLYFCFFAQKRFFFSFALLSKKRLQTCDILRNSFKEQCII